MSQALKIGKLATRTVYVTFDPGVARGWLEGLMKSVGPENA
jgi:hypothetical protein